MKKITKYGRLICCGLAVLCFMSLFLNWGACYYKEHVDYLSNGFQLIFGRKDGDYPIFGVNIFGLFTILLIFVEMILPFILKKNDKVCYLIGSVSSLFVMIFILMTPLTIDFATNALKNNFQVNYGLYVCAAMMLINALFCLLIFLSLFKESKKN